MKLFVNDVACVQVKDILTLESLGIEIPKSITKKVYKKVSEQPNFTDCYCTFDDEESKEFLKNADFIVDYSEYKKLNKEEREELQKQAKQKLNRIIDTMMTLKPYDVTDAKTLTKEFNKCNFTLDSYEEFNIPKALVKTK